LRLCSLTTTPHLFINQPLPKSDGLYVVDTKHFDGHSTNRRSAQQPWPGPAKAPLPVVPPRVEQLNEFARLRVQSRDIRALEAVAEAAIALPLNVTRLDPVPHIR
jgi:hypothetical protein